MNFQESLERMIICLNDRRDQPMRAVYSFAGFQIIVFFNVIQILSKDKDFTPDGLYKLFQSIENNYTIVALEDVKLVVQSIFLIFNFFQVINILIIFLYGIIIEQQARFPNIIQTLIYIQQVCISVHTWIISPLMAQQSALLLFKSDETITASLLVFPVLNLFFAGTLCILYLIYTFQTLDIDQHFLTVRKYFISYATILVILVVNFMVGITQSETQSQQIFSEISIFLLFIMDSIFMSSFYLNGQQVFEERCWNQYGSNLGFIRICVYFMLIVTVDSNTLEYREYFASFVPLSSPFILKLQLILNDLTDSQNKKRILKVFKHITEKIDFTDITPTVFESDLQFLIEVQNDDIFVNSFVGTHILACINLKCPCNSYDIRPVFVDNMIDSLRDSTAKEQHEGKKLIMFEFNRKLYVKLISSFATTYIQQRSNNQVRMIVKIIYIQIVFMNRIDYLYQPENVCQSFMRCHHRIDSQRQNNIRNKKQDHSNIFLRILEQDKVLLNQTSSIIPYEIQINAQKIKLKRIIEIKIKLQFEFQVDMMEVQQYYEIVNTTGLLSLYLLEKKKKIFCLLYNNYQNPQLFVLGYVFDKYRRYANICQSNVWLLDKINPLNQATLLLGQIFYSNIIGNQKNELYFTRLRNEFNFKDCHPDHRKILLKMNSDSTVLLEASIQNKKLIIQNCTSNLLSILKINDIYGHKRKSLVGQTIDMILPLFLVEIHEKFIEKFILTGQSSLLSKGIMNLYSRINQFYVCECEGIVRLKENDYQDIVIQGVLEYQRDIVPLILADQQGWIQGYSESAAKLFKLDQCLQSQNQLSKCFYEGKPLFPEEIQQVLKNINLYKMSPRFQMKCDFKSYDFSQTALISCQHPQWFQRNQTTQDQIKFQQVSLLQNASKNIDWFNVFICDGKIEMIDYGQLQLQALTLSQTIEITNENQKILFLNSIAQQYLDEKSFTYNTMASAWVTKITESDQAPDLSLSKISLNSEENKIYDLFPKEFRPHLFPDNFLDFQSDRSLIPLKQKEKDLTKEIFTKELSAQGINFNSPVSQRNPVEDQSLLNAGNQSSMQENDKAKYYIKDLKDQNSFDDSTPQAHKILKLDGDQGSSLGTSTERETRTIDNEVDYFINRRPNSLKIMLLVGTFASITISGLVIVNLILSTENYNGLVADSINQLFPDIMIQAVCLTTSAIDNLNYLNNYNATQFHDTLYQRILGQYLQFGYVIFKNETIHTYDYEAERHGWIDALDEQGLQRFKVASIQDQNKIGIEFQQLEPVNYTYVYFQRNIMINILNHLAQMNLSELYVSIEQANFIELNIDKIQEWGFMLEIFTKAESTERQEQIFSLILIVMVTSVLLSFALAFYLLISIKHIQNRQAQFAKSYFLFSREDLQPIIEVTIIKMMLDILGLREFQELKKGFQTSLTRKQGSQIFNKDAKTKTLIKEHKLRIQFITQNVLLVIILCAVGIVYFIPFYVYMNKAFQDGFKMDELISSLGLCNLDISQRQSALLHSIGQNSFKNQYQNDEVKYLEIIQSRYDIMDDAELYITQTLRYDSFYNSLGMSQIKKMMDFTTQNLCDVLETPHFNTFIDSVYKTDDISFRNILKISRKQCQVLYEGGLTKGYKFFATKFRSDIQRWEQDIFPNQIFNSNKAKYLILEDPEFLDSLYAQLLISQLFHYLKFLMREVLTRQQGQTILVLQSISYSALALILGSQVGLLLTIVTSLYKRYKISAETLLIFGQTLLKKNKHLMQSLANK